jgi:hypothetical protein
VEFALLLADSIDPQLETLLEPGQVTVPSLVPLQHYRRQQRLRSLACFQLPSALPDSGNNLGRRLEHYLSEYQTHSAAKLQFLEREHRSGAIDSRQAYKGTLPHLPECRPYQKLPLQR